MKKHKNLLAIFLVLIMIFSLLVACNKGAEEKDPDVADKPTEETVTEDTGSEESLSDIQIAYVSGDLANEIFATQVEAMQKYSDEIGVTFLNTPCKDDPAKISAIENYVEMGVDVIIVHVGVAETLKDSMEFAQSKGIKFFAYDTAIEGCDAFFGWDNYDYGYAIGAAAANWVNENFKDGEVCNAVSANYPSYEFLVIREQGYIDAINELCGDKVNWVGEAVGGTTANGVTAGENWLQMGVDINLVVGINDAGCLGVYEAFNAAGYGGDKVAIYAGDAVSDALNAMTQPDSIYRGTVLTGLVYYAPQFIDICVNMAQGNPEHYYYGGLWFVTNDNVEAYMKSGSAADLDQYSEYYIKDPE
ncbi:MAG: sugar ABC transporter substrate-binding protein [Ruminococcaceae bacterium]|nr:sugar ABC transporter substrate-binding protein [Oscillospiraceae bacterium]